MAEDQAGPCFTIRRHCGWDFEGSTPNWISLSGLFRLCCCEWGREEILDIKKKQHKIYKSEEPLELFIKAPTEEKDTNEFVMGSGMDTLEMEFYKNILPTFVQFEEKLTGRSELRNLFPKFYDGECKDGDFYLILENLCKKNFSLVKCNTGLDWKQMKALVQKENTNFWIMK